MPHDILSGDIGFPQFDGSESTEQKLDTVLNYLYMLKEELRYLFGNLNKENFNSDELDKLVNEVSEPLYHRIEDADGNIASLRADADSLGMRVDDAEGNISALGMTADAISAQVESMDGDVAQLSATSDKHSSMIAAVVKNTSGGYRADASLILSAINGQSAAALNADKINFSGAQIMLSTTGNKAYIALTNRNMVIDSSKFKLTGEGNVFSYGNIMLIGNGQSEITFADGSENIVGSLSYCYRLSESDYALYMQSYGSNPLKLYSASNMSIDSKPGGTVYIGTADVETVTVGKQGGRINLIGDVYVNGTRIG